MAVAFDATGAGTATSGTAPSWSHTVATAGANVYAFFCTDRASTISSVTCGGSSMTSVGSVTLPNGASGNAVMYCYKLANAAAGAQTISGTFGTSTFYTCNSVSYTGVNSELTPTTATGTSTSPQITVSAPASGDMTIGALCNLSTSINSTSGGTNRVLLDGASAQTNLVISDTTSAVTFSDSLPASEVWGAFAVELSVSGGAAAPVPTLPLTIPNPYVGPMALRNQKRMPYVSSQRQGYTDAANQAIVFGTSDDGFVQPGGLMPPLIIPNPFVGPQALRNQKRMPYVSSQRQGFTDGANVTVTFTTSDDGFVDRPYYVPVRIPNPFVGPMALRNLKRMPSVRTVTLSQQALSDGANSTWTFTTSDDGFVQPGGLMPPLQIPNPFVGPMALRNQKRMPYVASQRQGFTDAANLGVVFATSDDGFVQPAFAYMPVIIPNPFVGPMALRQAKRMPYVGSQRQGFTDAANITVVFSTSDDGLVQHRDPGLSAPLTTLIPNPFVGPQALRNQKRMPYVSSRSQGLADGANLQLVFATSDDGFVTPSIIDFHGKVIVGPNEIRSVTLPQWIWSAVVANESRTYIVYLP